MICVSQPVRKTFSFDVRDYGAIGDGNPNITVAPVGTDNTTALQAALDAINAAGGGLLEVPTSKTFEHAGMLTIYSNTYLRGNGYNSSVLRFTGDGGTGISTGAAEIFVVVENIKICTSDKDNGDSKQGAVGFRIQGTSSEIKLLAANLQGYSLSGVSLTGACNNVMLSNGYISNCGDNAGAGLLVPAGITSANGIRLTNMSISNNNGWGIMHEGEGKGWCLTGNLIEGNAGGGFDFSRLNACLIAGNYFENNASTAQCQIKIQGFSGTYNTGISIRGNFFAGYSENSKINIDYVDGFYIEANHFQACNAYQIQGVLPARVLRSNQPFINNFDAGSSGMYHDGA